MKVIILGAGYGTRLYPLTKTTPKPLLLVGGIPIIDRIFNNIYCIKDISDVFILTNNKFIDHFHRWLVEYKETDARKSSIQIINDQTDTNENRLGPIGDLIYLFKRHTIDEDTLILAGDNLFEKDMNELVDERNIHNASILCVHEFDTTEEVANKYGVVTIDEKRRIKEFQEKPAHPQSALAATAMYLIRKEDLRFIHSLYQRQAGAELNAGELIIEFLRQKAPVYCSYVSTWFDIGTIQDFEIANHFYALKN
jgi:glucose-1-phosphate thymidylyltransferase